MLLYNLRGERVRVLADGPFPAGENRLVWDGTDAHGVQVASGVYLVRVSMPAEGVDETRKIVLAK